MQDLIFVQSVSCTKGGIMFIAFSHSTKMLSVLQVKLCEHFSSGHTVSEFIHEG